MSGQRAVANWSKDSLRPAGSTPMGSVEGTIFNMAKTAYNACLNLDQLEKIGLAPLIDILSNLTKIFPFNNLDFERDKGSEVNRASSVKKAIALLEAVGIPYFLEHTVEADEKDPDIAVLKLSPPILFAGLPSREHYDSSRTLARYRDIIGEVFARLKQDTGLERRGDNFVVDFEMRLVEAYPLVEDLINVTVRLLKFSEILYTQALNI
jgi:predicted metalloendopeptidase